MRLSATPLPRENPIEQLAKPSFGPGQLDELTELATSPKPKRFRDERGKPA